MKNFQKYRSRYYILWGSDISDEEIKDLNPNTKPCACCGKIPHYLPLKFDYKKRGWYEREAVAAFCSRECFNKWTEMDYKKSKVDYYSLS